MSDMQWTSSNYEEWSRNRYIAFIRTAEMIGVHASALATDEIKDSGRGYVFGHMMWGSDMCNKKNLPRNTWQQNEAETLLYFAKRYHETEYPMWKSCLEWYAENYNAPYLSPDEIQKSQASRPSGTEIISSDTDDSVDIELID